MIVRTGGAIWLNFATVLLSVSAIIKRRDMGLYEVPLPRDRDNTSQLQYVIYYGVDKSRFKHTREECKSKMTGLYF